MKTCAETGKMEQLLTVRFLPNIQNIRILKLVISQFRRHRKGAKICAKCRRTVVKQTGIPATDVSYIPMIKIWGLDINAAVEQDSGSLDVDKVTTIYNNIPFMYHFI